VNRRLPLRDESGRVQGSRLESQLAFSYHSADSSPICSAGVVFVRPNPFFTSAMIDFEIQRCSRRCAATDRELAPGEVFYSVLVSRDAEVVRCDYSEQAWQGAPEDAIGWWKSRMPEPNAKRAHWAPNDVMLDYFHRLEEQNAEPDVRYILALLMIRRRILRLEDSEVDDSGNEELVVFCPRNEAEYRVRVVSPDPARAGEIQEELAQLLFADAA
jgi:hypothetical protein